MQATDKFRIGIIGGAGGMGRWFGAFFEQAGHPVHVSGHASGPRPAEMAAACPVVIVSVPIAVTESVIREVGPHMKKDSLLMDLTSLKAGPVRAMLEASASEVIGLHPLFGPGVMSLEGQNIALCPARASACASMALSSRCLSLIWALALAIASFREPLNQVSAEATETKARMRARERNFFMGTSPGNIARGEARSQFRSLVQRIDDTHLCFPQRVSEIPTGGCSPGPKDPLFPDALFFGGV